MKNRSPWFSRRHRKRGAEGNAQGRTQKAKPEKKAAQRTIAFSENTEGEFEPGNILDPNEGGKRLHVRREAARGERPRFRSIPGGEKEKKRKTGGMHSKVRPSG